MASSFPFTLIIRFSLPVSVTAFLCRFELGKQLSGMNGSSDLVFLYGSGSSFHVRLGFHGVPFSLLICCVPLASLAFD
jgi:hypothetical protein